MVSQALESASELIHQYITENDQSEVLQIALDQEIAFYDATYAWLAKTLKTTLYTRDRKLAAKIADLATAVDA